ncbi:hypothetical protein N8468_08990 [Planktomarina temperata]|nr:hypothetical protein [Planktomarina temperata]
MAQTLRYGENPHQSAAFYTDGQARPGVATAVQHQGKELSYNNNLDANETRPPRCAKLDPCPEAGSYPR